MYLISGSNGVLQPRDQRLDHLKQILLQIIIGFYLHKPLVEVFHFLSILVKSLLPIVDVWELLIAHAQVKVFSILWLIQHRIRFHFISIDIFRIILDWINQLILEVQVSYVVWIMWILNILISIIVLNIVSDIWIVHVYHFLVLNELLLL